MDPSSRTALSTPSKYNLINFNQVGSLVKSKQPIMIDFQTGSIHVLGLEKTGGIADSFETDRKIGNSLLVAAKLLKKEKLTDPEKSFKKIANRIVDYYKKEFKNVRLSKMSQEEKLNLSQNFKDIGHDVLNKTQDLIDKNFKQNNIESRQVIDEKIKIFANRFKVDFRKEFGKIQSNFKQIHEYGSIHTSNGLDAYRHLEGGFVIFKDADGNVFFKTKSKEKNTENPLLRFKNNIEITLQTFATNCFAGDATKDQKAVLNKSISDLINTITIQSDVTRASEELNQALVKWAESGNPAEMNLCRLVHAMNQLYNISWIKGPLVLISDYGKESPYQLLGLGNSKIKFAVESESKVIEYQFKEDEIVVTHQAAIVSGTSSVKVLQITTLTSSYADLENWKGKYHLKIEAKENETALANAIQRIYTQAGYDNEIIIN